MCSISHGYLTTGKKNLSRYHSQKGGSNRLKLEIQEPKWLENRIVRKPKNTSILEKITDLTFLALVFNIFIID